MAINITLGEYRALRDTANAKIAELERAIANDQAAAAELTTATAKKSATAAAVVAAQAAADAAAESIRDQLVAATEE